MGRIWTSILPERKKERECVCVCSKLRDVNDSQNERAEKNSPSVTKKRKREYNEREEREPRRGKESTYQKGE